MSKETRRNILSYLAGFFDGEGCVGIYPHRNSQTGKQYYELTITVTQKDRTILNLFQAHFGGNIVRTGKPNIRRWYLSGPSGAIFLTEILPYLMVKAGQAKIALEFQRAKTARQLKGNIGRGNKEIALEEAQKILCQKMKHE